MCSKTIAEALADALPVGGSPSRVPFIEMLESAIVGKARQDALAECHSLRC